MKAVNLSFLYLSFECWGKGHKNNWGKDLCFAKQKLKHHLWTANTNPYLTTTAHTLKRHLHYKNLAVLPHTHTHPFNGPFSGTTRVSRYQKDKTNLDFTEARDSEWQWHQLGHMQSAPRSRQITTLAPHHSVFYRPDALPAAQPTASKHWRHMNKNIPINTQAKALSMQIYKYAHRNLKSRKNTY